MKIDDVSDALRELGNRVFDVIERLTGIRPSLRRDGECYKAVSDGRAFLWVHFYGDRAGPNRRNAVVLNTLRARDAPGTGGATAGNEFHGLDSVEIAVRPDEANALERAEAFIRQAIAARPEW